MNKILTRILCVLLLLLIPLSASAQENVNGVNLKSECEILDAMAESWILTCQKNAEYCTVGAGIYALGQLSFFNDDMIKQVYQPLKEGITDAVKGSDDVQISLKLDGLTNEFLDEATGEYLKDTVKLFCDTRDAEFGSDEWKMNQSAELDIHKMVKDGEIAKDVDILDAIKENYAFVLGKVSCSEAIVYFQLAKITQDIEAKRNYMLIGASLATFGCEMSIENTDEIFKAPYTKEEYENVKEAQQAIMTKVAENAVDVVEDLVPQIKIANDVIELTTDVGLKLLSMNRKLDTLGGFIKEPNSIEENKNAFYNALTNQYDRFVYSIADFEIIMKEYKGYLLPHREYVKVDVPNHLFGFPVVGFSGVFADGLDIKQITIPDTIKTRTLSNVVNDCDNLETVYYNATNCEGNYIGYFFSNCDSDFQVIFGNDIEVIPEKFIANCGLSAITFPESVKVLNTGALVNCDNLKTLTIPSKVEKFEIGFNDPAIVSGCPNLQTVYYNAISPEGSYYNAVFSNCGNDADKMEVIFGQNVKSIPRTFIINCGVKNVVFPEGLTQILGDSIIGCKRLETITIPSTVVNFSDSIADECIFSKCDALKTVNYNAINATGETGVKIFYNIQSDFTIHFGDKVESIPENFLSDCALTSISFPEGVRSISCNCLMNCDALRTVRVSATVENIGYNFIDGCNGLEKVYFNANCTTYRHTAMISDSGNFDDPATQIILGENVTTVPGYFIQNCAIKEFVYPEGVKVIGLSSLVSCSALETVVIPSTVEQLDYKVIDGCTGLKKIEYRAVNAQASNASSYIFMNSGDETGLEICFAENIESLPSRFMALCNIRSIVFPKGITEIPTYTISKCSQLTSLTIPKGITIIAKNAIKSCPALTEIYYNAENLNDLPLYHGTFTACGTEGNGITVFVEKNVKQLPANLFSPTSFYADAPKIISVQFANDSICTTIGDYAFRNCAALTEINIPAGVTFIGEYAFCNCVALTEINIPAGVTFIGEYAFHNCAALTEINIPAGVTTIHRYAFAGCLALSEVTIAQGIHTIDQAAFADCTSLSSIRIPESVTAINYEVFSGCSSLKEFFVYSRNCSFNKNCGLNESHRIYGYRGSTAESFADQCGSEFIPLDAEYIMGDINKDGKVNIGDVSRIYAHIKGTNVLDPELLVLADITGDGTVNMGDIAKLYAQIKV